MFRYTARAGCFVQQEDLPAALAAVEESLALRESLVDSDPNDWEAIRLLANAEMNLAIMHRRQGNLSLARKEYQMSLERRRPNLDREDSSHDELLRDQAKCFYNLAKLEMEDGRLDRAVAAVTAAIEVFERCLDSTAQPIDIRQRLGHALFLRGELLHKEPESDLDGALAACDRAVEVFSQLANENPLVLPLRQALGEVELLRADIFYSKQDRNQSLAAINYG